MGALAAFWLTPGSWGAQSAQVQVSLTFTPSTTSGVSATTRSSGKLTIPGNFPYYFAGLQTIPTSKTLVTTGGVTPLGYVYLHNTDNINYVSIYSDSSASSELLRLYPGDVLLAPLGPSATVYAKANVASVALETYVVAR
jgi:hypothetical protein